MIGGDQMTGAQMHIRPPQATAQGRAPTRGEGRLSRQNNAMSKIDCLIEVVKKLKEARTLGERSSDRALLYFIDMTIAHVCDQLDARFETKGAADDRASAIKAAA